jgi:hypothetical protein
MGAFPFALAMGVTVALLTGVGDAFRGMRKPYPLRLVKTPFFVTSGEVPPGCLDRSPVGSVRAAPNRPDCASDQGKRNHRTVVDRDPVVQPCGGLIPCPSEVAVSKAAGK